MQRLQRKFHSEVNLAAVAENSTQPGETCQQYSVNLRRTATTMGRPGGKGRIATYRSTKKPAKALVLCNARFKKLGPLTGHETDINTLKDLFKEFDIEGFYLENGTAADMSFVLTEFPKKFTGDEYFCAVFILSHGGENDEVIGYDGRGVDVNTILNRFDNTREQLQNMPKLIFFQCCRGTKRPYGVTVTGGESVIASSARNILPRVSDTLVAFSTQEGEVSIVNNAEGSWYIQELAHAWRSYGEDEHILDVMMAVNDGMSTRKVEDGNESLADIKIMSDYKSSLRKKLYLKRKTPSQS